MITSMSLRESGCSTPDWLLCFTTSFVTGDTFVQSKGFADLIWQLVQENFWQNQHGKKYIPHLFRCHGYTDEIKHRKGDGSKDRSAGVRQDSIAQEKLGIGPSVWHYFLCKTGVKKISGFAGCDGNVMLRDYLHSCGRQLVTVTRFSPSCVLPSNGCHLVQDCSSLVETPRFAHQWDHKATDRSRTEPDPCKGYNSSGWGSSWWGKELALKPLPWLLLSLICLSPLK